MVMKYSESIENYIEQILALSKSGKGARVTDIANGLNVSKASVAEVIKKLKKEGLVTHQPYRNVYLTDKGKELATKVQDKHFAIERFMIEILGVSAENAGVEACKIEHIISEETYSKILEKLGES